MVKVSEVYKGGGSFLSAKLADELELYQTDLKIAEIETKKIKEEDKNEKIILHFEDIEELLPLNVTNARILQDSLGDETDDWINQDVQLLPVKRNYQGRMVDAIQVMVVGQKKLQGDESQNNDSSNTDKKLIKEAMKKSGAIKSVVGELSLMDEAITVTSVVNGLKSQLTENMITKKQYNGALELLNVEM